MPNANQIIRESLQAPELDARFVQLTEKSDLASADNQTALSWIRAVRDECATALRKATGYEDLISRMVEFQLRAGLFELISVREGQRAQKQKLQSELLQSLQKFILHCIEEQPEGQDLLLKLRVSLEDLLSLQGMGNSGRPGSMSPPESPESEHSIPDHSEDQANNTSPDDGPILFVETDNRMGLPDAPTQSENGPDPMESVEPEISESDTPAGQESELARLHRENQELKKKLQDFLDEWGEGIRIDGNTVSILTHRKIIVRKSRQDGGER